MKNLFRYEKCESRNVLAQTKRMFNDMFKHCNCCKRFRILLRASAYCSSGLISAPYQIPTILWRRTMRHDGHRASKTPSSASHTPPSASKTPLEHLQDPARLDRQIPPVYCQVLAEIQKTQETLMRNSQAQWSTAKAVAIYQRWSGGGSPA